MLPFKYRLNKKKEFDNVFKLGKVYRGHFFFLKVINNQKEHPRVGIIVSKKVSRKAVERNKIKRWLRSILNSSLKEIKEKGLDIIVFANPQIMQAKYQEVKQDLEKEIKRIK